MKGIFRCWNTSSISGLGRKNEFIRGKDFTATYETLDVFLIIGQFHLDFNYQDCKGAKIYTEFRKLQFRR